VVGGSPASCRRTSSFGPGLPKGALARTGQHGGPEVVVTLELVSHLAECIVHRELHRVQRFGPIERHIRHAAAAFEAHARP